MEGEAVNIIIRPRGGTYGGSNQQEATLEVDGIPFHLLYESKHHRYVLRTNRYREMEEGHLEEISKGKGEAIIDFLEIVKEQVKESRKASEALREKLRKEKEDQEREIVDQNKEPKEYWSDQLGRFIGGDRDHGTKPSQMYYPMVEAKSSKEGQNEGKMEEKILRAIDETDGCYNEVRRKYGKDPLFDDIIDSLIQYNILDEPEPGKLQIIDDKVLVEGLP